MKAEQENKFAQAIAIALSSSILLTGGDFSFAKEGEAPRMSFFGLGSASSSFSSPYVNENREDPIYSPYSPYGNGEKSVYNNQRKGSADELKFWRNKFDLARYIF